MPATPAPDAEILAERLVTGGFYTAVHVVAASGSTNADLAELARSGGGHGTVLVTDNQTAGRGRFTRAWTTPPGVSVALSILVIPEVEMVRWTWLPLVTGVAVARGVRRAAGVDAALKWPNDVLVDGRKLCGLLAERVDGPHGPGVVMGIGINISMDESELPVDTATSLLLAGAKVDKTEVVACVLEEFATAYALWRDDPDALVAAYVEACDTIGREVKVMRSEDDQVEGQAVGVDDSGALLVRVGDIVQSFAAGDVFHLRPRG